MRVKRKRATHFRMPQRPLLVPSLHLTILSIDVVCDVYELPTISLPLDPRFSPSFLLFLRQSWRLFVDALRRWEGIDDQVEFGLKKLRTGLHESEDDGEMMMASERLEDDEEMLSEGAVGLVGGGREGEGRSASSSPSPSFLRLSSLVRDAPLILAGFLEEHTLEGLLLRLFPSSLKRGRDVA